MLKTFLRIALFGSLLIEVQAGSSIPEPMVFDLIRPLDSKKGELEVNTLVSKSISSQNKKKRLDPFGSGQTTRDYEQLEWAPEIEYAVADGFALEFELPTEGTKLEAYKFASQYTFGKVNESYIHGVQLIVEPDSDFKGYNTSLLYLGGYRFDETYSTLFMLGGRMNLEGRDRHKTFEYLANATLFAELTHRVVVGLETNYASYQDSKYSLAIIPQIHYEAAEHVELQVGMSFGDAKYAQEQALVFRAIYTF